MENRVKELAADQKPELSPPCRLMDDVTICSAVPHNVRPTEGTGRCGRSPAPLCGLLVDHGMSSHIDFNLLLNPVLQVKRRDGWNGNDRQYPEPRPGHHRPFSGGVWAPSGPCKKALRRMSLVWVASSSSRPSCRVDKVALASMVGANDEVVSPRPDRPGRDVAPGDRQAAMAGPAVPHRCGGQLAGLDYGSPNRAARPPWEEEAGQAHHSGKATTPPSSLSLPWC